MLTHTPYDGSSRPFTVGLKPIEDREWLEPDARLEAHLLEKQRLLSGAHGRVFQAEPDTDEAQEEILNLVVQHLKSVHGELYSFNETGAIVGDLTIPLSGRPALETAARLIQEDLVLMRSSPDVYRLAAACLCFPSSWSLREKFSQSMHAIHENVPGFNDGRMGAVVERLFENLKVGQLVCRYNWSIYDDADLHHPEPKQLAPQISNGDASALASLFMRVERQTLRRLARSGDILFTIKIHHDPLAELERHPERGRLARSLSDQLAALNTDQLVYKGLTRHREILCQELQALAQ
ncbi:conserved hypothetical protein [Roseibium sp. TrichSKD4]|uniref:heme-dependent oxidative N-demethylase family protein n=1 Tax=Roseibium sp. TrichSKD4 TaxID=744980 RepID=UPI0001E56CE4|nr:DUF3445 domain-containing protein [Roseibium sp. TrichSKD4]EFO31459.1 conserved hypothetical protein [Roseibium sp. TrichSKD4]